MITKLKSKFGAIYKVTSKNDLTEFAKNYLSEPELNEMINKVNNYKNYENINDGYLGIKRVSQRTYIVEFM